MTPLTYAIQSEGGGPIKIGSTVNLKSRLSSLQTAHPARLVVLATLDIPELDAHRALANHRIRGEWFWPNPEVIAYIKDHSDQRDPYQEDADNLLRLEPRMVGIIERAACAYTEEEEDAVWNDLATLVGWQRYETPGKEFLSTTRAFDAAARMVRAALPLEIEA